MVAFGFRAVEVFAGRKLFVPVEVIGAERFGDFVFFAEPFTEVHEFAAMRAERTVGTGKPVAFLFTRRTFDLANRSHLLRFGKVTTQSASWQRPKVAVDNGVYSASFGGPGLGIIFMPNTKSAERRMRNSVRKQSQNKSVKSRLKTLEDRYADALKKDRAQAEEALRSVSSALDKAAKTGVIHSGTAARKKSRLAVQLNRLKKAA
jgi:small subunit ribosomal protein S20